MQLKGCSININYSLFCLLYKLIHKKAKRLVGFERSNDDSTYSHCVQRRSTIGAEQMGPQNHLKLDQPLYQCDPLRVTSDSHDGTMAHYLWWDHFQDELRKRDTGIPTQFLGPMIKWQYWF